MRTARRSAVLLVACALAGMARADDLGTLFYSPEERARMDQLRRGDVAPAPAESAAPAKPAPPLRPPVLTGYVQRSDGRDTVWIDGRPVVTTAPQARALDPSKVGKDLAAPPRGERKDRR